MSDPILWTGWLYKAGNENNRWRKRFFVLRGNMFKYFESDVTAASAGATTASPDASALGSVASASDQQPRGWIKLEDVVGMTILWSRVLQHGEEEAGPMNELRHYADQYNGTHASDHVGSPKIILFSQTQLWRLSLEDDPQLPAEVDPKASTFSPKASSKARSSPSESTIANLNHLFLLIERAVPRAVVRASGWMLAKGAVKYNRRYVLLLSTGNLLVFKDTTLNNLRRHIPLGSANVIQPVSALAPKGTVQENKYVVKLMTLNPDQVTSVSSTIVSTIKASPLEIVGIRIIHPTIPEKKGYVFYLDRTPVAANRGSARTSRDTELAQKDALRLYDTFREWVQLLQAISAEARVTEKLLTSNVGSKYSRTSRLVALRQAEESRRLIQNVVVSGNFQRSPAMMQLAKAGFPEESRAPLWFGFLNANTEDERQALQRRFQQLSRANLFDSTGESVFLNLVANRVAPLEWLLTSFPGEPSPPSDEPSPSSNGPSPRPDEPSSLDVGATTPASNGSNPSDCGRTADKYACFVLEKDQGKVVSQREFFFRVEADAKRLYAAGVDSVVLHLSMNGVDRIQESVYSLFRALVATTLYDPSMDGVQYSIFLLPILCNLFYHQNNDEAVFWTLQSLFSSRYGNDVCSLAGVSIKPPRTFPEYHTHHTIEPFTRFFQRHTPEDSRSSVLGRDDIGLGVVVDARVFLDLLQSLQPIVFGHCQKNGMLLTVTRLVQSWFLSLFTVSVVHISSESPLVKDREDVAPSPFSHSMLNRVWDVFFLNGSGVLIRMALTLFRTLEMEIQTCKTAGELAKVLVPRYHQPSRTKQASTEETATTTAQVCGEIQNQQQSRESGPTQHRLSRAGQQGKPAQPLSTCEIDGNDRDWQPLWDANSATARSQHVVDYEEEDMAIDTALSDPMIAFGSVAGLHRGRNKYWTAVATEGVERQKSASQLLDLFKRLRGNLRDVVTLSTGETSSIRSSLDSLDILLSTCANQGQCNENTPRWRNLAGMTDDLAVKKISCKKFYVKVLARLRDFSNNTKALLEVLNRLIQAMLEIDRAYDHVRARALAHSRPKAYTQTSAHQLSGPHHEAVEPGAGAEKPGDVSFMHGHRDLSNVIQRTNDLSGGAPSIEDIEFSKLVSQTRMSVPTYTKAGWDDATLSAVVSYHRGGVGELCDKQLVEFLHQQVSSLHAAHDLATTCVDASDELANAELNPRCNPPVFSSGVRNAPMNSLYLSGVASLLLIPQQNPLPRKGEPEDNTSSGERESCSKASTQLESSLAKRLAQLIEKVLSLSPSCSTTEANEMVSKLHQTQKKLFRTGGADVPSAKGSVGDAKAREGGPFVVRQIDEDVDRCLRACRTLHNGMVKCIGAVVVDLDDLIQFRDRVTLNDECRTKEPFLLPLLRPDDYRRSAS